MNVNTYTFEKYNSDYIKFNGNVKVKGGVDFQSNKNKKIQIDRFCITRENPDNPGNQETQCMEASTLAFLHNNKDHRLNMICLGNTCIDDRHIKILNGDHDFKLKSKQDNKCLTHTSTWLHEQWAHHSDWGSLDNASIKHFLFNHDCDAGIRNTFGLKWVEGPENQQAEDSTTVKKASVQDMAPKAREMHRQSSFDDKDINFTVN